MADPGSLSAADVLEVEEPGDEADAAQYVPAGCDLVEMTLDHVKRAQEKGWDPHVDRVIVRRLLGHNRHENLGTYAAKGSTRAALSRYGAGIFDVWGMNRAGKYLCMKRHRVSVAGAIDELPSLTVIGNNGNGGMFSGTNGSLGGGNALEMLMFDMLRDKLRGNQDDPLRSAMADMMKMNALGIEQTRQALQVMMTAMTQARQPEADANKQMFEFMKTMVLAERASNAKGGGNAVRDALEFVQLGVGLARAGNGETKDNDGDGDPPWLKLVLPMAETMGPGVVATIAAAALPKDKADLVIESINKHMEARAAEAKAEAGVVDTEGTSVA